MPWIKGQSGNRGGRPKALAEWRRSDEAQRLRSLAYDVLEAAVSEENTVEWKDRIVAAKELLARIEGNPIQAIGGEDGGPIDFSVNVLGSLRRLVEAGKGT